MAKSAVCELAVKIHLDIQMFTIKMARMPSRSSDAIQKQLMISGSERDASNDMRK